MPARQLSFTLKPRSPKGRGGARPGAGRPRVPESRRGYVVHAKRPRVTRRTPVHVTLKLAEGRPSLRNKEIFRILRKAVATARLKGLRVVHFSILSNHLHLLLEPDDILKAARCIQSLAISFARRLNLKTGKRGPVFAERYHLRLLRSPTEARRALAYVLGNEARHAGRERGTYFIGPFSSGHAFTEWRRLFRENYGFALAASWSLERIERWLAEILAPPETWLLREGWRKGATARIRCS